MKISLYGLPTNLLNSYYKIFDRKNSLLQVLEMKDYHLYPVTFSIPHIEVIRLMYSLSQIIYFDTMYLYNILDGTSELYMDNAAILSDLNFDENHKLNTNDYEKFMQVKTNSPWLFPYDKVLIPNLTDLDLFMVDIEEVNLSFLLVKKSIKNFKEIEKEVSSIINKDEALEYMRELSFDCDLKNKIVTKCNYTQ